MTCTFDKEFLERIKLPFDNHCNPTPVRFCKHRGFSFVSDTVFLLLGDEQMYLPKDVFARGRTHP